MKGPKNTNGQGAAHGKKGGGKSGFQQYGASEQSTADKEAMSYAGKCSKNR